MYQKPLIIETIKRMKLPGDGLWATLLNVKGEQLDTLPHNITESSCICSQYVFAPFKRWFCEMLSSENVIDSPGL